jgi:TPP-dependent pyruvate/acetoin dehydrogenase alpha subunit
MKTAEQLQLYETMLKIRRTEEQLVQAHQRGLVPGACHTYIGEEVVAAAGQICAMVGLAESTEGKIFSVPPRLHGESSISWAK